MSLSSHLIPDEIRPAESRPYVASIIIPVMDRLALSMRCLASVAEQTGNQVPFEVIVVDNGSRDETPAFLRALDGDIQVIRNETNLGFAAASNQGARAARGKYLVFLNNDTQVTPGWLQALVDLADSDPSIGIVGAKLLYPDGRLQHAGLALARGLKVSHIYSGGDLAAHPYVNRVRDFQAVTAACMLLRRGIVDDRNPFDEAFRNGYEDVDLCFRVGDTGHRIVYCPASVVYHHENVSEGRHDHDDANHRLLRERWQARRREDVEDFLLEDGYYPADGGDWKWCGFDPAALKTGRGGPAEISLVVPVLDDLANLPRMVLGAGQYTESPHEVVLVDRGSRDGTQDLLRVFEGRDGFRVIRRPDASLLDAVRQGVDEASAPAVALLAAPVAVTPEWDRRLRSKLVAGVGAVGPLMNIPGGDQSLAAEDGPAGIPSIEELSAHLARTNAGRSRDVDVLETQALLAPRRLLAEVLGEIPDDAETPAELGAMISDGMLDRGHRLFVARDAMVYLREGSGTSGSSSASTSSRVASSLSRVRSSFAPGNPVK